MSGWRYFIYPSAVAGALVANLGLLSGGGIILITLCTDQWQRSHGYKLGEGTFTDREGDEPFGLRIAEKTTDLGDFLSHMVKQYPEMFGRFENLSLDLTVSEGRQLRSMVRAAQGRITELLTLREELREIKNRILAISQALQEATAEVKAELEEELENAMAGAAYGIEKNSKLEILTKEALEPVAMYLESIPAKRVRR